MPATIARSPHGSASGSAQRIFLSAFRGERASLSAALRTMSSAGDCHAPTRPLRYPQDAGYQDLARLGQDMYRAMGRYAVETSSS